MRHKSYGFATDHSLTNCMITCDPTSVLWPLPTGTVRLGNTSVLFSADAIHVQEDYLTDKKLRSLLQKATKVFLNDFLKTREQRMKPHSHNGVTKVVISLKLTDAENKYYKFKLHTDESYKLMITKTDNNVINVVITAITFFGARHGLETLSQLIWWDDSKQLYRILDYAKIYDRPYFTYRGLLLDTSRQFVPKSVIKQTLDAMAMCKMNMFHWHLSDTHSFPYYFSKYSKMAIYGAYSDKEVYTSVDVKEISEYAEIRGISVIIEIDSPGRIGHGWEWGEKEEKGNFTLCLDTKPWEQYCSQPPCGQANPANENVYLILKDLLLELIGLTGSAEMIHIGGSDVNFPCWENSQEVTDMEAYAQGGILGVWGLFQQTIVDKLSESNIKLNNIIMWSNLLTGISQPSEYVNADNFIIETTGDFERLLMNKYRIIIANVDNWYLNFHPQWESLYMYRPWADAPLSSKDLILGGEACLWTDTVSGDKIDYLVWPQAAALAGRLWSDPHVSDLSNATMRMSFFRERLVERGIKASPIGPKWCYQNPGMCL